MFVSLLISQLNKKNCTLVHILQITPIAHSPTPHSYSHTFSVLFYFAAVQGKHFYGLCGWLMRDMTKCFDPFLILTEQIAMKKKKIIFFFNSNIMCDLSNRWILIVRLFDSILKQ